MSGGAQQYRVPELLPEESELPDWFKGTPEEYAAYLEKERSKQQEKNAEFDRKEREQITRFFELLPEDVKSRLKEKNFQKSYETSFGGKFARQQEVEQEREKRKQEEADKQARLLKEENKFFQGFKSPTMSLSAKSALASKTPKTQTELPPPSKVYNIEDIPTELFATEPDTSTETTPEIKSTPEPMGQFEAAARGVGQGAFGLGDEVVAAFKAATSGKTYSEELAQQQKYEEQAAEEYPVSYYGGQAVGTGATMLIPGLGVIGRTAQAVEAANALRVAKTTLDAAKAAGAAAEIANATKAVSAARGLLTKELIRGGAQSGALTGLGTTKGTVAEDPVDAAANVILGAGSGAALNVAVPKAAEKISELTPKPIKEAVGKGFGKVTEALGKVAEGDRWNLFPGRPELQVIVKEMVAKGKKEGLTDTQILNNLKVEFGPNVLTEDLIKKAQAAGITAAKDAGEKLPPIPKLTEADFERAFKQNGLAGAFKRVIAGSQRLTEFIERPEQMARAKQAFESQTSEELSHQKLLEQIDKGISLTTEQKNQLNQLNDKKVGELQQKLKTLEESIKSARGTRTQERLKQELANADEELKLANKISEYTKFINGLEETAKNNEQSVKIALRKNYESQSEQNLDEIRRVYNKVKDHSKLLGDMREVRIEELQNVPAEAADIEKFMKIRSNLQGKLDEEGMGRVGNEPLNAAFSGDNRYHKLNTWVKIKDQQKKYDIAKANKDYNDAKGLTETTGGKSVDWNVLNQGRPQDPDQVPSIGDIVGVLYAGNKKISSSAYGTPLAAIKTDIAKVLQEEMKDFDPKIYDLQRNMSRTMSEIKAIEKSPFLETGWVPVKGETGRVTTAPKKFMKTELADIRPVAEETKDAWQKIGLPTYEIEEVNRLMDVNGVFQQLSDTPPNKLNEGIIKLRKQYEDRLNSLLEAKNRIVKENKIKEVALRKNERLSKAEIQSQIDQQKQKTQEGLDTIESVIKDLQTVRNEVLSSKSRLSETEQQLAGMYREAVGLPPSARDIGQAAVIGAKGQVPFSIGKILIPPPETRIKLVNKITSRFKNPSLTSAVRVAIERPITISMIRSLSQTHKVSEPELIKTLEESGVVVQPED